MGALDDLIATKPPTVLLNDEWHRKIAEARVAGCQWDEIAAAIAQDTSTVPMISSTLRGRHEQWLRRQG